MANYELMSNDHFHQFRRYSPILLLLSFTFILTNCSSHISKSDGPPNYYVDETKVPDATPRIEPRSRYGNMHSYNVFGKRYHVMKSGKNYHAVGIASWYGTKFNHHLTSNGERYDMLSMTAAHKTLPLPTYVEVTNLANHRKIIVKVNDRGPFEANRIIDLSYVAAKKLGMLDHGTAKVRIVAIDPRRYKKAWQHQAMANPSESHDPLALAAPQSQTPIPQAVYFQIGAFHSQSNALKLKHRLMNALKTPVDITTSYGKQIIYHVQIGPINDVTLANKLTKRLQQLGFKLNLLRTK